MTADCRKCRQTVKFADSRKAITLENKQKTQTPRLEAPGHSCQFFRHAGIGRLILVGALDRAEEVLKVNPVSRAERSVTVVLVGWPVSKPY